MTTINKLVRMGDNVALILDDALLKELGIDADSEVELSITGQALVVSPYGNAARAETFRNSVRKIVERHADLFRRLGGE